LRASISISLCFSTSLSPSSSLLLIHKMQRSSNSSRVTEELFKNASTDTDQQELPTYDPLSHIGKKEKSRLRSAEYAIHVIPLLLVLCAIILWFFSNSPGTQVLSSFYFVTLPFVYFLKRYSD
jgi:positive regulator of sigma E activity